MIAKISATENLGGALGYNFKKVYKLSLIHIFQSQEYRLPSVHLYHRQIV